MNTTCEEHEYLRQFIRDRWYCEIYSKLEPLQEGATSLLEQGCREEVYALTEKIVSMTQPIWDTRFRAEEILGWLMLDTRMRKEGMTFPNWFER